MNKLGFTFSLYFTLLYSLSFSQRKINCFKHNLQQGLWITYLDSAKTQISTIGKYRKGNPKGLWKYYSADGALIRKEKIHFGRLYTEFYYPDGKLYRKGKARIVHSDKITHYFFYGVWKTYTPDGELLKENEYNNGIQISEKIFKTLKDKNLNDSLVEEVRALNKQLYKYSDSLQFAETNYGKQSKQYNRFLMLNNFNALNIFNKIDTIIAKYGYPGKTLVGDEYAIVFSIISSGNISIKEKYYDIIIKAAYKGELEWKDVAYFIDKIKIGKKEKQIYGTQFKLDTNKNILLYYPIENRSTLNERRKKVGLDEYDLYKINDSAEY